MSVDARSTNRSRLMFGLRAVIALALVYVLGSQLDLDAMARRMTPEVAVAGAIAVALLLLAFLLSALRWEIILRVPHLTLGELLKLYLIGGFFGLFLPTAVGGDAVRMVALGRSDAGAVRGVASVILDRLFGLAALALLLVVGVVASPTIATDLLALLPEGLPTLLGLLSLGLIGGLAFLLIISRRRIFSRSERLSQAFELTRELAREPRRGAATLSVALAVQVVYVVTWMVLARGVGIDTSVPFMLVAVPLVSLASMIPLSISGIGLREGAWVLLLAPMEVTAEAAVLMSVVYFAAFAMVCAIGGVLFMSSGLKAASESAVPPVVPGESTAQEDPGLVGR